MYIILKLCCFDCNKFFGLFFCNDEDYLKFIENLPDSHDYSYIVYSSLTQKVVDRIYN